MADSFSIKKQTILVGLGLLLAADLGLAAYSWQTSTALRTPMAQLDADSRKLTLLSADIDHAEKIRHDLPATVADCDKFEASLPLSSTGNSAIDAELDDLAAGPVDEQDLAGVQRTVAAAGQDADVHRPAVVGLHRHGHVVLVDEQAAVGLGHLLARHDLVVELIVRSGEQGEEAFN